VKPNNEVRSVKHTQFDVTLEGRASRRYTHGGTMLNRTIPLSVVVAKVPGGPVFPFERQQKLVYVAPPGTDPHALAAGNNKAFTSTIAPFASALRNT
jgi:hypothetical protein